MSPPQNDTSRTLEGELNFPLPLSGVVSGFGYEINGNMVDGVVVEKEAARVAFEKEVRSGGKAALVEHVQGPCCSLYLEKYAHHHLIFSTQATPSRPACTPSSPTSPSP